jgi:hypothetical protein
MSNENNNYDNNTDRRQELIKSFLDNVERKLPFWLKDERDNINDILEELETHIWDRATELAEGGDPSEEQIELVIEQMGSPGKIAGEYKRRGKPKFYITEELFPLYQRILIIAVAVLASFNFLGMLFSIGSKGAGRLFGDFFQGIFISFAIALILITIQFVMLSREGYLPEDFSRFTSRLPITVRRFFETRPSETTETAEAQPEVAAKTAAIPTTTETKVLISTPKIVIDTEKPQIVKETIIVKEPRIIREERRAERAVSYKYSLGKNYLSEGITGIAFGAVLVILPFLPVFDFIPFESIKYFIVIFGGLTLVVGVIRFMQAIVGRVLRIQQGLMFLSLFPQAAFIPLFLGLIRPILGYDGLHQGALNTIDHIIANVDWIMDKATTVLVLQIIVYVIVGITSLVIIAEMSRIAKLGSEGFPVREVKVYR